MGFQEKRGIGYCGLACALCSDKDCPGCAAGIAHGGDCSAGKCAAEKGLDGCYACPDYDSCTENMPHGKRSKAFNRYASEFGLDALMERLRVNNENGITYHTPDKTPGDYDVLETEDEIFQLLRYGRADPYIQCPTFENERFLLRLVEPTDAEDLLLVYADPNAQDILTDCSAWNCDFGYGAKDLTAMQDCIGKWIASYENHSFVRMTIFDKQNQKAVGTIEAYRRAEGSFCGGKICLRLDLHSDYEEEKSIDELLSLIVKYGIKTFGADGIVTRATPIVVKRIKALVKNGFILSDETLHDDHGWGVTYGDFWVITV
jgi:RimJ/RimL family protein N-acetyltransferase